MKTQSISRFLWEITTLSQSNSSYKTLWLSPHSFQTPQLSFFPFYSGAADVSSSRGCKQRIIKSFFFVCSWTWRDGDGVIYAADVCCGTLRLHGGAVINLYVFG